MQAKWVNNWTNLSTQGVWFYENCQLQVTQHKTNFEWKILFLNFLYVICNRRAPSFTLFGLLLLLQQNWGFNHLQTSNGKIYHFCFVFFFSFFIFGLGSVFWKLQESVKKVDLPFSWVLSFSSSRYRLNFKIKKRQKVQEQY